MLDKHNHHVYQYHQLPTGDDKMKTIHPVLKFKYYILVIPAAAATLLLLLVNIGVEITFQSCDAAKFAWGQYDAPNDKSYFIKTEGCTIPAFDPFDPSVAVFHKKPKNIKCHNATTAPLVESNATDLWLVRRHYANYRIFNETLLSCCYRPFYRPGVDVSTSDDRHVYSEVCFRFEESTRVLTEFVRVECAYNGTDIYKDFHSFVLAKNKTIPDDGERFSVLIIGIDAVSRLNFFRTMPKTAAYLKRMDAIDFRGYNKVGDNTYPNLVPVLTGMNESELSSACYANYSSNFDDCPLIWKAFSNEGYLTALAEDASNIALFNYVKNGFAKTPTDYYWRTFANTAEEEIGHEKRLNTNLCVGPWMAVELLLAYVYKFAESLTGSPYFGFFWETSLTHDDLNYPTLGDAKYATLLKNLQAEHLLNDTVLVLLSDHGIRWGQIRTTHQGRMEERLPFLFFVLPQSFKDNYRLASANLRRNTKRLVTPFDLHETLVDLSNVAQLRDDVLKERISNESTRGISLFVPIGEDRTCQSAGISPHWCTCYETKKMDTKEPEAVKVADMVVAHLNGMLKKYVQCAKLNLTEIVEARMGRPVNSSQVTGVKHVVNDYTVVIRTDPGGGLFESTVRQAPTGWNVTGTVSRINLYGKQSYCVDDYNLKLYCYCDSPLSKLKLFR